MQLADIIRGMTAAQDIQDTEGSQHPGQCFAFTFPVTLLQRIQLRARQFDGKAPGLQFVRTIDPQDGRLKWMGCFKPRMSHAGAESVHP